MSAIVKNSIELECDICRSYGYIENYKVELIDLTKKIMMIDGWVVKTIEKNSNEYTCICPECYKYFVSAKDLNIDVHDRRSHVLKGLALIMATEELKENRVKNTDNNEGSN